MEQEKNKHISDLLYKFTLGILNEEEQKELDEWIIARPSRQRYLQMLSSPQRLQEDYHRRKAIDVEEAISQMKKTIDDREIHTSYRPILLRIAAVFLLFIAGGAFWYHHEQTRVTPPEINEQVRLAMEQSNKKGITKADVVSGKSVEDIISSEERALYHVDDHFAEQLEKANRITTHQDKEFWVTLEDGTLVHLNYNSRLIYPEKFGDRRDVILEGEAYFMVAKDKSRQFVVHTPQGDVKVYGTEFIVNTRDRQQRDVEESAENTLTTVVLVRGSVSFTANNGSEIMMTPGQQICINAQQTSVTLREVDTAPYIAWNEGNFFFEEWPLERIMQVISRWYGREVEFTSEDIKHQQYSGNFDRYEDIHPTMEAIESITGLKITFAPGKLIIEP